nr:MAG TPA: hypothetical protein [Caudoviricetes sp.]
MKKIFVALTTSSSDDIIDKIKETHADEDVVIYISEANIDIDADPNKYGDILDKISHSDIAYFPKLHNETILNQIEYQYCKDLGIRIELI